MSEHFSDLCCMITMVLSWSRVLLALTISLPNSNLFDLKFNSAGVSDVLVNMTFYLGYS